FKILQILIYSLQHKNQRYILYKTANQLEFAQTNTKRLYFVVNFFVYAIWITLLVLMGISDLQLFHEIEAVFAATLAILSCITFIIIGSRLHLKLRRLP